MLFAEIRGSTPENILIALKVQLTNMNKCGERDSSVARILAAYKEDRSLPHGLREVAEADNM